MGPLPASFCTGRNKFRVAKNSVLLNHPHSQFPVLTSSPPQSDKKTIRINAVIMFIQKGMIYPGLSAIGRSIQDPVWMVICTVTSFIPAYIKHDTNLDSQATASPMDSYPHISLYLIPFPIISQHPESVLCAIWSSQSALYTNPPSTHRLLSSASSSHWNLTLLWAFCFSFGSGGGGGGSPLLHGAASRPLPLPTP